MSSGLRHPPRRLRAASLALVLASVAFVASCVTDRSATEPPVQLAREKILALSDSVFEIVVPKRDENNVVYSGNRSLPVEELPFSERNDKYYSIGTAFAVSSGRLVSAAHVFQVDRYSTNQDFFVRDRSGKVHAIAQIKAYSQYRDLVEFTLQSEPARVRPLRLAGKSTVGDTVYTVGNANGEGIAIRNGQIASFTFEPVNGQWKDIRFSAPASPGNSGGPLLNTLGQVIGVVVRKNASENLNVAIPIDELKKLSAKDAEFFVSSSEAAKDGEAQRDWRFRTRLPATLAKLSKRAEADRRRFHLKQWARTQKERRNQSFPRDPYLQDFVWNQTYAEHVQVLSYDDKQGYYLFPADPVVDFTTSRGEKVFTLIDEPDHSLVQIEVPSDAQLTDYVKKPELLLEAVIEAFAMYREFNGRRIPLKSLGAPQQASQFVDALGRNWVQAVWRTHFNQGTTILNCLPSPLGFGCRLDLVDTADETLGLREKFELHDSAEIAMSYWGSMKNWDRFLALPKRYVPKFLQAMKLDRSAKGHVALETRDVKLRYAQPLFGEASWLFLGVGYGMTNPLEPEVQMVKLEHGEGFRISEVFEAIMEPPKSSGDGDKKFFEGIVGRAGDFNGMPLEKDGQKKVYRVFDVGPGKKGRRMVNMVSCSAKKDAKLIPDERVLESTCRELKPFFKSPSLAH